MIRLIPDHKRADLGSSIDPNAIEQFLFSSSKTKDEYLELTARVIVHFKHLQNLEIKGGTSKRKVEDDQIETLQSKRIKVKEWTLSKTNKLLFMFFSFLLQQL